MSEDTHTRGQDDAGRTQGEHVSAATDTGAAPVHTETAEERAARIAFTQQLAKLPETLLRMVRILRLREERRLPELLDRDTATTLDGAAHALSTTLNTADPTLDELEMPLTQAVEALKRFVPARPRGAVHEDANELKRLNFQIRELLDVAHDSAATLSTCSEDCTRVAALVTALVDEAQGMYAQTSRLISATK
jgi:ABC-type transporter Mla subunit MlaD